MKYVFALPTLVNNTEIINEQAGAVYNRALINSEINSGVRARSSQIEDSVILNRMLGRSKEYSK